MYHPSFVLVLNETYAQDAYAKAQVTIQMICDIFI